MRNAIKGGQFPRRNHPCPCGSGKKFKKCHMPRQTEVPPSADEQAMMDAVSPIIISPETIADGMAEGKSIGQILQETQKLLEQKQAEDAAAVSKILQETPPGGSSMAEAQMQEEITRKKMGLPSPERRTVWTAPRSLGKSTSLASGMQPVTDPAELARRADQLVKDTAHAGD